MTDIWEPAVELSSLEERILGRTKKRKIFLFLRQFRDRLFDREMQEKLASAYSPVKRGKERVAPAQLAMALILQAALDVPDHEVVELTLDSRRWQSVLDCFEPDAKPLFSQGTLFNFRQRMIEHDLDKELFNKTIAIARETGAFGGTKLRAAFDSCPLYGAGRVEDTFNLIGRAALEVVKTVATRLDLSLEETIKRAGIPLLGAPSIKAGLDLDWDDQDAKKKGIQTLLEQVGALWKWLEDELSSELDKPPLGDQMMTLLRLIEQDTEPDPDGTGRRISRGVSRERQISIHDPDVRHGRKSKLFNGYKRHVAVNVDGSPFVLAVALAPANRPERESSAELLSGAEEHGISLDALDIDRGYLGSEVIEERRKLGLVVRSKPFPLRNGGRFTKADFTMDFSAKTTTCPSDITMPLNKKVIHFPAKGCLACSSRDRCTISKSGGRSISIHQAEAFLTDLRHIKETEQGRAELRKRVAVEHSLARIVTRRGKYARYKGLRKNLFDLRRDAAVSNLHILGNLNAQQAA